MSYLFCAATLQRVLCIEHPGALPLVAPQTSRPTTRRVETDQPNQFPPPTLSCSPSWFEAARSLAAPPPQKTVRRAPRAPRHFSNPFDEVHLGENRPPHHPMTGTRWKPFRGCFVRKQCMVRPMCRPRSHGHGVVRWRSFRFVRQTKSYAMSTESALLLVLPSLGDACSINETFLGDRFRLHGSPICGGVDCLNRMTPEITDPFDVNNHRPQTGRNFPQ